MRSLCLMMMSKHVRNKANLRADCQSTEHSDWRRLPGTASSLQMHRLFWAVGRSERQSASHWLCEPSVCAAIIRLIRMCKNLSGIAMHTLVLAKPHGGGFWVWSAGVCRDFLIFFFLYCDRLVERDRKWVPVRNPNLGPHGHQSIHSTSVRQISRATVPLIWLFFFLHWHSGTASPRDFSALCRACHSPSVTPLIQ